LSFLITISLTAFSTTEFGRRMSRHNAASNNLRETPSMRKRPIHVESFAFSRLFLSFFVQGGWQTLVDEVGFWVPHPLRFLHKGCGCSLVTGTYEKHIGPTRRDLF
jgi:hypothetical protein